MKRKLLFAAVTLFAAVFMGGSSLKAQVWFETDLTKKFESLATTQWEGSSGQVGWAAHAVETNSGLTVAAWESYRGDWNGGCTNTGTVMKTTVSGLPTGTYKIELYGAAAFTYDRNFGSEAFTGDLAVANSDKYSPGDNISENTGVALYAKTSKGEFSQEIPIWYADNFLGSGLSTATLYGVEVGEDGVIEIGMIKTSKSTNWHVVQLKGVTATVDAVPLYESSLSQAQGLETAKMSSDALTALTTALSTYGNLGTSATVDEYRAAIDALDAAFYDANTSVANYALAKAILDAANTYDAAGQASYAADETIAAIQAAYNDGSLIAVTDEQKAAAQTALSTACKAQTQPADGCNMTAYIQNWDFLNCSKDDFPGWNITKESGNAQNLGTTAVEYWNASAANGGFDFYQNVTDLPTGVYIVQALMWNSTDNEAGAAGVNGECGAYGKSSSSDEFAPVTVDTRDGGKAVYATGEIAVIDGALRLGVKNRATMGGRWFGVDGIQLIYARQLSAAELEEIEKETAKKVYNEALAAAQAVVEGSIPATAYADLRGVITDNTLTDGTSAEYNDAAAALNGAVTLARTFINPYAAWNDLKEQAEALADVSNNNADANQNLRAAISDLNDAVEGATDVEVLILVTSLLKNEMGIYVSEAEPTNDECFDLTFMIVNPHFTEGAGGTNIATGWTLESGEITEHRILTHNFETYHKKFNLSQTIPNLPKGTYKVTLQGFARHDNNAETNKTVLYCGVATQEIKAISSEYSATPLVADKPALGDSNGEVGNNGEYRPNGMSGSYYYFQEINPATQQPFYTNEVQTLVPTAGDLKIGFKCETTTDWVIWDNFHLYYYGSAIEVEMDEDVPQTFSEDIENANVTLKRTIKEGLNSVVLPFSMTQAEVEEYFGEGSVVYVVDAFDDETSTVEFAIEDGIGANVPCILQATKAGTSYEINGRHIYAAEPVVSDGKLRFIGSYENVTIPSNEGNYILYNGELLAVDSDNPEDVVTMKGYRAYFKLVDEIPDGSRVLSIQFEDEKPTDIAEIDNEQVEDGVIYNLEGQVVGADYKGIAIINGKKVLLK